MEIYLEIKTSVYFRIENVTIYFHENKQFLDLRGRMGHSLDIKDVIKTQMEIKDMK